MRYLGHPNRVIHHVKEAGWLGAAVGTILLSIRLSEWAVFDWVYLAGPFLWTLLWFLIGVHYSIQVFLPNISSCANQMLLGCTYAMVMSTAVFLVLSTLKLDNVVSITWRTVFIAFWFELLIYAAFCVFIFPGLIHTKMLREVFNCVLYLVGGLVFSVLLVCYLDTGSPEELWVVLLPLLVSALLHAGGYFILAFTQKSKQVFTIELQFILGFVLLLVLFFLNELAWDKAVPGWVLVLPVYIYYINWIINEEVSYYHPTKAQCYDDLT